MEIEREVEVEYPDELKTFLQEKRSKAPFKLQENAFKEVLDWIEGRTFKTVVSIGSGKIAVAPISINRCKFSYNRQVTAWQAFWRVG